MEQDEYTSQIMAFRLLSGYFYELVGTARYEASKWGV